MSVDKVKVGVVGLGMVSFSHIRGFQAHQDAEVIAVCDLDETQAKTVAEKFGIPRHYLDFNAMLADPDINTIAIATPTFTHRNLAVAAAKAGKNIMCEKPFALSVEEGEEICAAAEDAGVSLAVDETYVFMTSIVKARELIDEGAIGKPTQIRQRFGAWIDRPGVLDSIQGEGAKTQVWREDSKKAGGNGFPWMFDHNTHFFATAEYLMNDSPLKKIYSLRADNSWLADSAPTEHVDESGAERLYDVNTTVDIPVMTWTFDDPACQCLWTRAEHLNGKYDYMTGFSVAVFGDKGMIEVLGEGGGGLQWNGEQVHLVLHRNDGTTETFRFDEGGDDIWDSEVSYYSQGHINRMAEFVDSLLEGAESRYSGRDGLRDLRSTIASICSAREGGPVEVADVTDERLYTPVGVGAAV